MQKWTIDRGPARGWRDALVPVALFGAALLARGWALGWGLPYVEHPDEPALVEVVVRMARSGDPNPHSFLYPTLLFYLLAAATRLHAWWGISQGLYASVQDLPLKTYLFTTSPGLYLWNRAVVAFLGAATVPALYVLGRRMIGPATGLLAALILLLAAFHVEHSHYITTDVPTGLWVVLALIGAWGVATTGNMRSYVGGGVMAGLAAGTKYNAGVVLLALLVAHAMRWRRASLGPALGRLATGGGLALLAFLATTPYALLDWAHFLADLRFNAAHYASGSHGDFVGRWQFAGYARFLWTRGLFAPGCAIALLGLPALVRHYPRQLALLFAVVAMELLLLVAQAVHFVRNVLPIYPLVILIAAAGANAIAGFARRAWMRRVILALLAGTLLGPQVTATTWLLHYWSQPYTMVAAAEALRGLPRGMRAAVELNPVQWAGDPVVFPVERLTDRSPEWYRANGFRYLVANSDHRSADDRAAYERLRAAARVVAAYPERRAGLQPGPGGALLDLGEQLDAMLFARRTIRFGDLVTLLGYEIRPGPLRARITPLEGAAVRELPSGQPVQINLYWRALAAIDRDYTLFVHVLDQRGERVAQRDLPPRSADYPMSRWKPGELVVDSADLDLSALPPGTYQLTIGLYDAANGARIPVLDAPDSTARGAVLTTLLIGEPSDPGN